MDTVATWRCLRAEVPPGDGALPTVRLEPSRAYDQKVEAATMAKLLKRMGRTAAKDPTPAAGGVPPLAAGEGGRG